MKRIASLGLLAVLLAGAVALGLADTPSEDVVVPAVVVPQPRPVSPPKAGAQADRTEVLRARPLFSVSRRPVAPVPEMAVASAALPRITGIILAPGRKSVIFATSPEAKPTVTDEGERIGDFLVQSIEPGSVAVLGPGGVQVLHPTFDPSAPAPRVLQ